MSAAKNTIILTRSQGKWLAEVGLSASSADDVTPVICAAQIQVTGSEARVTATDRYRVSSAVVKLKEKSEAHTFLLPRAALQWLNRSAGYHGRYAEDLQRVVITTSQPEIGPHMVTIIVKASDMADAATVSWTGELTKGNFPPVYTLVEKARDAEAGTPEARLNLEWFSKVKLFGARHLTPLVKFTKTDNPNKPGPVYLAWSDDGAVYAEAIIQPNLMLR
jgi:hypothetical protein